MQTLIKSPDNGERIHIEQASKTAYHVTRIYPVGHQITHAQFRVGKRKLELFRMEWEREGFIDADAYMQQFREAAAV